jgi:hypothetical protein
MTKLVLLALLILFVTLSVQTIAAIDVPPPPLSFSFIELSAFADFKRLPCIRPAGIFLY